MVKQQKNLQMGLNLFNEPHIKRTDNERVAYECFWAHHEDCQCRMKWRDWDKQTNRSIWELV